MEVAITGTIELEDLSGMTDTQVISQCINALMLARRGTIPGSRNFGLDQRYLSAPNSEVALNILGMELQEMLDEYMPSVDVRKVTGKADYDGHLQAVVEVERR